MTEFHNPECTKQFIIDKKVSGLFQKSGHLWSQRSQLSVIQWQKCKTQLSILT